ncbi:hypothetical protein RCO48_36015 [Peribacillus frigoritolerans]|nr:hypothetical protein [Peribacillus frigoritolerans]
MPKHILLIVDEAYYEYVDDAEYLETLPFLNMHSNLVILRTFFKDLWTGCFKDRIRFNGCLHHTRAS